LYFLPAEEVTPAKKKTGCVSLSSLIII